MAIKSLVVSDIGGEELSDDNHARVVVRHPDNPSALELDISTVEASKLTDTTLRLVSMTVYEPNKPPRSIQMETKVLDKLFEGVDFDKVLEGARKADVPKAAPAKRGAAPRAAGDKVDYTAPEHAGKLHRGRITEAEADWVRNNQDKASYNREQQTGKPIDFADAAEQKRYGMGS